MVVAVHHFPSEHAAAEGKIPAGIDGNIAVSRDKLHALIIRIDLSRSVFYHRKRKNGGILIESPELLSQFPDVIIFKESECKEPFVKRCNLF